MPNVKCQNVAADVCVWTLDIHPSLHISSSHLALTHHSAIPIIQHGDSLESTAESPGMNGKIFSLMALAPMLFHSIFGCCWHHAHFLPDHNHAVALADAGVSSRDHSHAPAHAHHAGCRAHGGPAVTGDKTPTAPGHPSEAPPCEQEQRCFFSGVATTVGTQCDRFDAWDATPVALTDLPLLQRSQRPAPNDLLARSPSVSARERCALSQVWLV